jgi:hypothetical protein
MANKKSHSNLKADKKYIDLFYMTPSEVTAMDLAVFFQDGNKISAELWPEMNILEVELLNENSVDFEPVEISFQDPSDAAFIKNRKIHTIFNIHLCDSDLDSMSAYFELITDKYDGFICADSADFTPVYAGNSKR